MAEVTKIETITGGRGRVRVYLDDAFAFVLYKKECKEYAVEEGTQLSPETIREITAEVLPKRAKLRAMHLLEKRPYTEKGLRDKLAEGLYPEEAVEEAIRYVASYGYLDDLRYAKDYASSLSTRKSRTAILNALLQKGVDKQTATQAIEETFAGEDAQDEEALIRALLQKKHYDPTNDDTTYHQKIYAFLYRKGFPHELIRRAMRTFSE